MPYLRSLTPEEEKNKYESFYFLRNENNQGVCVAAALDEGGRGVSIQSFLVLLAGVFFLMWKNIWKIDRDSIFNDILPADLLLTLPFEP